MASKGEIIDPDRLSQLVLLKDPIIIKMVIVIDVVSLFILELNSKIKLTESKGDVLPSSYGMTGLLRY